MNFGLVCVKDEIVDKSLKCKQQLIFIHVFCFPLVANVSLCPSNDIRMRIKQAEQEDKCTFANLTMSLITKKMCLFAFKMFFHCYLVGEGRSMSV